MDGRMEVAIGQRGRKSSWQQSLGWLTSLLNATSPSKGDSRQSLADRLRTYCDCLDDDADCMTAESLKAAVRRFKFFPTVAELVEFFGEWRGDRRSSSPRGELGDAPPAIVNSVARKVMRDWRPPKDIGAWGESNWEMWALAYAIDRVRDGTIRYTHEFRDGAIVLTLLDTIDAPAPTEEQVDTWRRSRTYL